MFDHLLEFVEINKVGEEESFLLWLEDIPSML